MALLDNEKYSRYYQRIGVIYQRPEIKASMEVIFSVFMVTILIFVAIRPTIINLAALQKKIVDKESVSTKADKKIAQLFEASNSITEYSTALPLYDSAVPSTYSYFSMIGRIEALSRKHGIELESVSIKGIKIIGNNKPIGEWATKILQPDSFGLTVIPVDFTVSGKPTQVKKFLEDIENMDRLCVIKNINLLKESGPNKNIDNIKSNGQLNYFVYTDSK